MSVRILIVLFLLLKNPSHCLPNKYQRDLYAELSLDYFKERGVQNVIFFLCWPKIDQRWIYRMYSESYLRITITNGRQPTTKNEIEDLFRMYTSRMGVVFDACCYANRKPFIQKFAYFNSSYTWLVFDCGTVEGALRYLKTLPLQINSDVVVTKNTEDDLVHLDLYDVYHTGFDRDGEFKTSLAGKWSRNDSQIKEWSIYLNSPKTTRRGDLNGMTIRADTIMNYNYDHLDTDAYLSDDLHPFTDSISKMNYQLIKFMKGMYNFTIQFVLANNWSDKNSKGFYQSGNLLGLLDHKKADVMAAAVILTPDRLSIADALYPTYPFRCGFIFRYLGEFGNTRTSFFSPFERPVWFCFLAIIITVIFFIWSVLLFENKYVKVFHKTLWNLSDTILSIIGALCQMGSEVTPVTSASRIVYFIFFFTSLVMYNFYTSSIVSSLLSFRKQTFNIRDLADSPLTCGSIDIGYVHNLLFDVVTNTSMDYFITKKKNKDFYHTIQDGIERVRRGGFAYNAEYNSVYKLIEDTFEATEICELQEIDTIPADRLAILAAKHSPYSEMFRIGLTKAAERGQLHRLLQKWVSRKPICQASKSFTEVGLNQTISSHLILYVGIGLSIGLVLLEMKLQDILRNIKKRIEGLQLRK